MRRRQVKLRPKAEARDKEAWCPWLSLRPCCIWIPHADHAQAEAQDQRCTWVKEKVSSKFELSCSQIVATEPLCDCGYFNSSNFGHSLACTQGPNFGS